MNPQALKPYQGHRNKQPLLSSGFLHVQPPESFMVARDSSSRASTRRKTCLVTQRLAAVSQQTRMVDGYVYATVADLTLTLGQLSFSWPIFKVSSANQA